MVEQFGSLPISIFFLFFVFVLFLQRCLEVEKLVYSVRQGASFFSFEC